MLAWAERNEPAELRRVLRDDGGVRYDGESARALLGLIRAWRDAKAEETG